MLVTAVSDLHGYLPEIPKTDLLLIGGDICPVHDHNIRFQQTWLDTDFRYWLSKIQNKGVKKVIGVFGNHDFIGEEKPSWIPKDLPWTYLEDSGIQYEGMNVWGNPWQSIFYNWAYNLSEPDLKKKWDLIPNNTNILVLHGPPYGYGDKAPRYNSSGYEHTGSPSLTERIKQLPDLKLCIWGHIHFSYGTYKIPELHNAILANVSIMNEQYKPVNKIMSFEI